MHVNFDFEKSYAALEQYYEDLQSPNKQSKYLCLGKTDGALAIEYKNIGIIQQIFEFFTGNSSLREAARVLENPEFAKGLVQYSLQNNKDVELIKNDYLTLKEKVHYHKEKAPRLWKKIQEIVVKTLLPGITTTKEQKAVSHILQRIESLDFANTEGIWRVSGSKTRIDALKKDLLEKGDFSALEKEEGIHNLTGLVKSVLEDIGPFISLDFSENLDRNIELFKSHYEKLPQNSKEIIKMLARHAQKVAGNAEINKMTADNLAIVFSQRIFADNISFINMQNALLKKLIENPNAFGINL